MVAQPDSGFHGHVGDEAVGTAATAVVVATFATADAAATNRVVCSFVCEGKTYEFDSEVRSSVTFPVALGAMHGELTLTSEGVGYWHVSLAQFATLPSVSTSPTPISASATIRRRCPTAWASRPLAPSSRSARA